MSFECEKCYKSFSRKDNMLRHKNICGTARVAKYSCSICGKKYVWMQDLKRHTVSVHSDQSFLCERCGSLLVNQDNAAVHYCNDKMMTEIKGGGLKHSSKNKGGQHTKLRDDRDTDNEVINEPGEEEKERKFEILNETVLKVKKFGITGKRIDFKIKQIPVEVEPSVWIKNAVEDIIKHITKDVTAEDQLGMTFSSENFKEKAPGYMPFKQADQVTFEDVWDILTKIFQSNSEGLSTDTFRIAATSVKMPAGKGRRRTIGYYNNFHEECRKRGGIISINNTDNLCLPRALVVAKAFVKKTPDYKTVREGRSRVQREKALKLLKKTGITIPDSGAGIEELKKFQALMKKYKITVYKYGTKGRQLIFEGQNTEAIYKINLLYDRGHFNVITSLTSAFTCSYFCEACSVPYNTKDRHRCEKSCPGCQSIPPCERSSPNITCDDCNRLFKSRQCFENHRKMNNDTKTNICQRISRCKRCLKTINLKERKKAHNCGEIFCRVCRSFEPVDHRCYMQQNTGKPSLQDFLFVFFDLETRQERSLTEHNNSIRLHEPNLCVVQQVCDKCIDDENLAFCQKCGYRQHIYSGDDCVIRFMEHVMDVRKKFKKITCIAHNGQAFDLQFVFRYVLQHTQFHSPNVIMRGSKILLLEVGNVRFIDSLNYFPMALADLPKAFGLSASLRKGYFPHFYNTKLNENYIGPLPDVQYYGVDSMKKKNREVFIEWYEKTKNAGYVFNMSKEIVGYCIADVDILRKACIHFRKLFLKTCDVCPFTEAITIASACNLMFRRKLLKPKTIGIIPRGGYRHADRQSAIALQWLTFEEKKRNIRIKHAGNQREICVPGTYMKPDGVCLEKKLIFEFHGCYYHGCPSCFRLNRNQSLYEDPGDTFEYRLERTKSKTQRMRDLKYEVIEMWECEFKQLLQTDKNMLWLNDISIIKNAPLNPRDAFYGGRTGNTVTYYEAGPEEKIKYVDVCSLYPWVCKYGKFPMGHPVEILVGNEDCRKVLNEAHDLSKLTGLIKCSVLPPRDLFHPLLPVRMNEKLLFVLCRTCGENMSQTLMCSHSEEDRVIHGTWVVDEVAKAVSLGYELKEIQEIWRYDSICYDPILKTGGLFAEFIDMFIQMKQEASGWPNECLTDAERQKYIDEYLISEGVRLRRSNIVKNPGLRQLAKLMLNSFWGKFGQRENQSKTAVVKESKDLYELLTSSSLVVNYIQEIDDDVLLVNWEYREEAVDQLSSVNVVLAAYVTALARLKLYSYLEPLGDRALYYDTDSVIFVSHKLKNEYQPPLGNNLGDLTDELETEYGHGSYISEIVSGGPKNYAYRVYSPLSTQTHEVCKVKGITLNHETSQKINFEKMKALITSTENSTEPVVISSLNIRRTQDHQVVSRYDAKTFKINSKKRVFDEHYSSLPYGYKKQKKILTVKSV